jgi:hypothetical protein
MHFALSKAVGFSLFLKCHCLSSGAENPHLKARRSRHHRKHPVNNAEMMP